MTLTLIDGVLLAAVAISALLSIRHGFVREALSLATWLTAFGVAWFFAKPLASLLAPYIESEILRIGLAGFLLIAATLSVGGMVTQVLGEFVYLAGLSSTDRFLGIFFGAARGLLIALMLVTGAYHLTDFEQADWWQESALIPPLMELRAQLEPIFWEKGEQLLESNDPLPLDANDFLPPDSGE